ELAGYVAIDGVVSIDASAYHDSKSVDGARWTVVPNLGRTGSSVTPSPADAVSRDPGETSPNLQYTFTLLDGGDADVHVYLSPTLNFKQEDGLKFAIAIDDEPPQIVNINEGEEAPDWKYADWWMKA